MPQSLAIDARCLERLTSRLIETAERSEAPPLETALAGMELACYVARYQRWTRDEWLDVAAEVYGQQRADEPAGR